MWLTLEDSVELGDLLGMSQDKGIGVMEELKACVLLGPHAMYKPSSMTLLSSPLANSTLRSTGRVLIRSLAEAILQSLGK